VEIRASCITDRISGFLRMIAMFDAPYSVNHTDFWKVILVTKRIGKTYTIR
jgi:hypothetical protein